MTGRLCQSGSSNTRKCRCKQDRARSLPPLGSPRSCSQASTWSKTSCDTLSGWLCLSLAYSTASLWARIGACIDGKRCEWVVAEPRPSCARMRHSDIQERTQDSSLSTGPRGIVRRSRQINIQKSTANNISFYTFLISLALDC